MMERKTTPLERLHSLPKVKETALEKLLHARVCAQQAGYGSPVTFSVTDHLLDILIEAEEEK